MIVAFINPLTNAMGQATKGKDTLRLHRITHYEFLQKLAGNFDLQLEFRKPGEALNQQISGQLFPYHKIRSGIKLLNSLEDDFKYKYKVADGKLKVKRRRRRLKWLRKQPKTENISLSVKMKSDHDSQSSPGNQ